MIRRLTTQVLLFLYGVIALSGQGLHALVDDDCTGFSSPRSEANLTTAAVANGSLEGAAEGHHHDCDSCPICQHQSLGQHFVAPAPAPSGHAACESVTAGAVESPACSPYFSPALPRAPPATAS